MGWIADAISGFAGEVRKFFTERHKKKRLTQMLN
jgi:hypothetical protein